MKGVFILLLCSYSLLVHSQSKNCTSLCKIDPIKEEKIIKHFIYTGADTTGMNVKLTKILVAPERTVQVKKFDKNCNKPNFEDCYFFKIETIPPVTMNLYTLTDPSVTSQYEVREEKVDVIISDITEVEKEVICPANKTKTLILKIQKGLKDNGYDLPENGLMDEATTLAIEDFQRSQHIAYGEITLETLTLLGVN